MTEREERVRDERLSGLIIDVACYAVSYGLKHTITEDAVDALHEYVASVPVARDASLIERLSDACTYGDTLEHPCGRCLVCEAAAALASRPAEPAAVTCECGRIAGGVQVCPTCGTRGRAIPIEGALRELLERVVACWDAKWTDDGAELIIALDRIVKDARAALASREPMEQSGGTDG